MRHPSIPRQQRGTYEALTTEPAINHLKKLGVTAVELMPVHHHSRDRHLEEKGLTNYWGYNSYGYFAPERRLAASRSPAGAVREFKRMVRTLHEAGLEVILDVVYNHTAEGNQLGPTPVAQRHRQFRTTGWSPRTAGTTWTTRARATR